MAFITKAFNQFYKLINPKRIPDRGWYTASFTALLSQGAFNNGQPYSQSYGPLSQSYVDSGGRLLMFSNAFLNYPGDPVVILNNGVEDRDYRYLTTRYESSSLSFRDKTNNPASMSAMPWGSQAGDFLWNVATPSWSFSVNQSTGGGISNWVTWTPVWTSKSFHSLYSENGHLYGIGTSSVYPVTSSWKIFDPKYLRFQYQDAYPSEVGVTYDNLGLIPIPLTFATHSSCYKMHTSGGFFGAAAGLDPNIDKDCFNEASNEYFDLGGGAAITQVEISQSMDIEAVSGSSTTTEGKAAFDVALRKRRLYFPITYSGSGQPQGTDYWLKAYTGFGSNDMFTENGSIYNVRFKVKRWNYKWMASDQASPSGSVTNWIWDPATNSVVINTGSWDMATAHPAIGSFMNIFIHNVASTTPAPSQRVPGAPGWYPPANNIVTIGNQYGTTPEMTFINAQNNTIEEQFDIVLVQYGYPAQLCFEPSGSAAAPFGCIIDDIQICKIGVTTDPRFTQQQTTAQKTEVTQLKQKFI